MNVRDIRTIRAGIGLSIFLVVATVTTVVVVATIRPFGASGQEEYRAVFTSASQLQPGDQVRVAGVVVGRISEVEVNEEARAVVTFTADEALQLTDETRAEIRYLNLLGDRYLVLQRGDGDPIEPGATLPVSRTSPALDLNDLFNGFKPLFAALSPDDVNTLSYEIIATLQGEGPNVNQLLRHTASLTSTIADREEVIGKVVDNLNQVLGTLDSGESELNQLVIQLTRFMSGLAEDRQAIGDSIESIDRMADATASLLHEMRPALRRDIEELGRLVSALNQPVSRKALRRILREIPEKLARITRSGSYGSWFNFYLCDLRVNLDPSPGVTALDFLFNELSTVSVHDPAERCDG
ncbi:MCE family protein [Nocardioides limicola]|uniref:MCE family protein n=1 Tax=Nocardioides limicola TaxID=2803368 RepID=UPI00193B9A31|nr:MCE family protein [Nocardioides sp. DJM-14]